MNRKENSIIDFMTSSKLTFLISSVLLISIFTACSDDPELVPDDRLGSDMPDVGSDAENIPQWIYEEMSFYYFWNSSLPDEEPAGTEDPEEYFNSLLFSSDQFSYISDDAEAIKQENTGTIVAMGFSPAYGAFTNSESLFAIVEYVYPGSPADQAGLKRGDIILEINGETLSSNNFLDLTATNGFSVTLGDYNGRGITQTSETISINTGIIELDPVIHQEVKTVGSKKVGYLVFVDFISGEDDIWLNSLSDALSSMKSEGISELVLDLRYNPGGEVFVANYLASALAPASAIASNEVLVKYEYNDELQEFFEDRQGEDSPNLVSRFSENENNLDLSNLYVLTTGATASASELVINGLEPYMNVTVIGEPTFGKFYGSFVLYDQNDPPEHNWAIAPVVLKYANANGVTDFVNGLSPDIFLQDDLLEAKEFGDETDPVLATALTLIDGGDISGGRFATDRKYTPIYDLRKLNKKNVFFENFEELIQ